MLHLGPNIPVLTGFVWLLHISRTTNNKIIDHTRFFRPTNQPKTTTQIKCNNNKQRTFQNMRTISGVSLPCRQKFFDETKKKKRKKIGCTPSISHHKWRSCTRCDAMTLLPSIQCESKCLFFGHRLDVNIVLRRFVYELLWWRLIFTNLCAKFHIILMLVWVPLAKHFKNVWW